VNFLHWHLMLNHFPLAGVAFGAALLQWGVYRRTGELQKAGLAALTLSCLLAVAVYWTGDEAAEIAHRMPGWSAALIELHEEAAEAAVWAAALLGAVAAWALKDSVSRAAPSRGFSQAVALLAAVCLALLAWASYRGGQIRHSEIQPDWKEWR
jgi:hypothetical protein